MCLVNAVLRFQHARLLPGWSHSARPGEERQRPAGRGSVLAAGPQPGATSCIARAPRNYISQRAHGPPLLPAGRWTVGAEPYAVVSVIWLVANAIRGAQVKSMESGTVTEYGLFGQNGLRRGDCGMTCETVCPNDVFVISDTVCAG